MAEFSAEEVRNAVRRLVVALAPSPIDEPLGDKDLIKDLGYHSLALLELVFAVEDEFRLQPIDQEQAQRMQTVEQVEGYVLDVLKKESVS